ncbi:MAG TPA: crossover junction endodeoxyribonuclease RuvC [Planctomycetota bacterium]|nr:crossover junction endodeoxyribonuclease RuvC [Planctomycetota bacterium]
MAATVTVEERRVRVLGIDPGTRMVGFGVLELRQGAEPLLVACGSIRLPPRPLAARLETIFREVQAILETHRPHVLAIEQVFHGKNFQSILKVGEARGVVVLAAQMGGLEIEEYAPAMIKKATTGNGRADKAQVQSMVTRLLHLDEAPEPVDVTDALAAAFCHHHFARVGRVGAGRLERGSAGDARRAPALAAVIAEAARRSGRGRSARGGSGIDVGDLLARGKARMLPGPRRGARRGAARKAVAASPAEGAP